MNSVGDVKGRVRALVGDPDGDWVTDAYLMPLMNHVYRIQTIYLKNATGSNLEAIIDVPAVEAGVSSLASFQKKGQPLAGLADPLFVWWKQEGQAENYYREAYRKHQLPHVPAPGQPAYGRMWWTWIGNKLLVTPMAVPVDFEIHGRFNPPDLAKDEDILVVSPDMDAPLTTGTLVAIGLERQNQIYLNVDAQSSAILDNIAADLIRQKQGEQGRLGRMNRGRGNSGWWWG